MRHRGNKTLTGHPAVHGCGLHPWLLQPNRRAQGTVSRCPCLGDFVQL
jgi:hypothetical protein